VSYIDRSDLPIDNSRLELKIRLFAVGPKPWLFANTPAGGHASALICSVVGLVKANGKEPYAWLCNVYGQNLAKNLLAREQWG